MRSVDEILARIEDRKEADLFGFEWPFYLYALPFVAAKSYLKDDASPEYWEGPLTDEQIRNRASEYLPFAWEKANNCRGISANRSISHYIAWLWLLGETWGDALMDHYEFYGKPQLERISEYFGVDWKSLDDGRRSNTEY